MGSRRCVQTPDAALALPSPRQVATGRVDITLPPARTPYPRGQALREVPASSGLPTSVLTALGPYSSSNLSGRKSEVRWARPDPARRVSHLLNSKVLGGGAGMAGRLPPGGLLLLSLYPSQGAGAPRSPEGSSASARSPSREPSKSSRQEAASNGASNAISALLL